MPYTDDEFQLAKKHFLKQKMSETDAELYAREALERRDRELEQEEKPESIDEPDDSDQDQSPPENDPPADEGSDDDSDDAGADQSDGEADSSDEAGSGDETQEDPGQDAVTETPESDSPDRLGELSGDELVAFGKSIGAFERKPRGKSDDEIRELIRIHRDILDTSDNEGSED